MSLSMATQLSWRDPRIILPNDNISQSGMRSQLDLEYGGLLDGEFVESCLWEPNFRYLLTEDYAVWKMSPRVHRAPAFRFNLYGNKVIMAESDGQLTTSCQMSFQYYPFDQQVGCRSSKPLRG